MTGMSGDVEPVAPVGRVVDVEGERWREFFAAKLLPSVEPDGAFGALLKRLSKKHADEKLNARGAPAGAYAKYVRWRRLNDRTIPALIEHGTPDHRAGFVAALSKVNLVEAGEEWVATFDRWVTDLNSTGDIGAAASEWWVRKADWLLLEQVDDPDLFGESFDVWADHVNNRPGT